MQTDFHSKQLGMFYLVTSFEREKHLKFALGASSFGLPLDSGNPGLGRTGTCFWPRVLCFGNVLNYLAADWAMFTAASLTDNGTRNNFIEQIHQYAGTLGSNVSMNAPLTTVYDPTTGNTTFGTNRYALLPDLIKCRF